MFVIPNCGGPAPRLAAPHQGGPLAGQGSLRALGAHGKADSSAQCNFPRTPEDIGGRHQVSSMWKDLLPSSVYHLKH